MSTRTIVIGWIVFALGVLSFLVPVVLLWIHAVSGLSEEWLWVGYVHGAIGVSLIVAGPMIASDL